MLMVFLSVAALIVAAVISQRSLSGRPEIDRTIKGFPGCFRNYRLPVAFIYHHRWR